MKQKLPIDILEKSAKAVRFMGHPQRLRILEFLDVYGLSTVTDIMNAVGGKQVIVSQSLKKLKQDGLVQCQRSGRNVLYELSFEAYNPSYLLQCMRRKYAQQRELAASSNGDEKEFLPVEFIETVAKRINFLGHPLRLRILEYLDVNGQTCVCHLMDAVEMEQALVSQALKRLKQDDFVEAERKSNYVFYDISTDLPRTLFRCMRKNHFREEWNGE